MDRFVVNANGVHGLRFKGTMIQNGDTRREAKFDNYTQKRPANFF